MAESREPVVPRVLAGAAEVTTQSGNLSAFAVAKSEFLDVRKTLVDAGIGFTNALVPAKLEGVTFGADVTLNGAIYGAFR